MRKAKMIIKCYIVKKKNIKIYIIDTKILLNNKKTQLKINNYSKKNFLFYYTIYYIKKH